MRPLHAGRTIRVRNGVEMELLFLLALFALIVGMVRVFLDTWSAYFQKQRSLATAIAITCVVAGIPILAAFYVCQELGYPTMERSFQIAGMVVFYGAGISGAIGLIWDRRIAKRQTEAGSDGQLGKSNHDKDQAD